MQNVLFDVFAARVRNALGTCSVQNVLYDLFAARVRIAVGTCSVQNVLYDLFAARVRNAVGTCVQWKSVNDEGYEYLPALDLLTE